MDQADVFDAIIIGAGAAGLAAAKELRENGCRIVVLEARNRVGGRIFTYRDPMVTLPIELGAEFLHGHTPVTDTIINAAGLTSVDVVGEHWQAVEGQFKQFDFWKAIGKVLDKLDEHRSPDRSFADYLSERAARKRKPKDARARRLAKQFVQGFHAADPAVVSERWLSKGGDPADSPEDERTGRVLDGYDRIGAWLARDVYDAIELNTVASKIEWQRGSVTVTCRNSAGEIRSFAGKTLIVTLPVGVLQASAPEPGAVTFDPVIPAAVEAINGLRMGPVVRTVFSFAERFWEKGLRNAPRAGGNGLASLSFVHSPGATFPIWWTQFPVRAPMLVGWMGGPPALELCSLPDAEIERIALHDLASHLGSTYERLAGLVQGSWMHNWERDPYSRGAYSYAAVGGSGAGRRLARPIEQTIFFSGEATNTQGRSGTVEGALATGSIAARGVLQALGFEVNPNQ